MAALWLACASLFFYGWWNPRFVLLLLGSVVFNYGTGYLIGRSPRTSRSKLLLTAGVAVDLVVLCVFKYANFFVDTAEGLTGGSIPHLDIVLPLGISFFTFTQIAFLVDVHRGLASEYNFIHYLLFVTYFPHLIAGPVLHHKQMMPQFGERATYSISADNVAIGMTIFTIGLAKKVLLADNFADYASPVFDAARDGLHPKLFTAWVGALAYTLQLYFDFSGYSDMAIGLSRLFGVSLPLNFASPYKAHNIIEFWRRWHMSLSQFLRDYLYFPLGGNRRGKLRRYVNLLVTMLLGGLWHGASWTFAAWGGLHGVYLVVNHAWHGLRARLGMRPEPASRTGRIAGIAITFFAVVVAWVLFRASNFESARSMLAGMFGFNGISLPEGVGRLLGAKAELLRAAGVSFTGGLADIAWRSNASSVQCFILLAGGLFAVWALPNTQQWIAAASPEGIRAAVTSRVQTALAVWRPAPAIGLLVGSIFGLSLRCLSKFAEFLYFRF
jgi:alginate O-acetyltransferase complex protein AlgI